MTAISDLSYNPTSSHIRPLNPQQDLGQVADLIELCFADTLDADGKRYLRRMRKAAQAYQNSWLGRTAIQITDAADGFVWEEAGRIVGNISLIPFINLGNFIYLIANVAVHPDYRRRGIARSLTSAALEWVQKKRTRSVWLQVRDNNPPAYHLYESAGFIEKARRTTWKCMPDEVRGAAISGVRITSPKSSDWKSQRTWLLQNYPEELFWYWPLRPIAFRSGLWGLFTRMIFDTRLRHWAVEQQGALLGVLSWRTTHTYADQLWLAAPPESEDIVLQTLLPHLRWPERSQRPLSLDLPVGRASHTLQTAGFRPEQTLIWMELKR
jgi:ribosomal protein S18 acetylase RimI-like enzyme